MAEIDSKINEEVKPNNRGVNSIDREKTCPLLCRVFLATAGRHHSPNEYYRGKTPSNELQIYTWLDATLKELTGLIQDVNPEARKKGTYFDFAVVQPDPHRDRKRPDMYRLREIGVTCSGRRGEDDGKSLFQLKFQPGDYIDVNITTANISNNRKTDQRGDRDRDRGRDNDRRDRRDRPY